MTRRVSDVWRRVAVAAAAGAIALALPGCGGEEEPEQRVERPAPRPTTPEPDPIPVSPLEEVDLDVRVRWPERREPSTVALAQAIATLANGLARGDESAVRSVLTADGRAIMDRLREEGAWERAVEGIELIRVCALEEPAAGEALVGLGVQDEEGAFLLGWRGVERGGEWRFTALPLVDATAPNARALDGTPLTDQPAPIADADAADDEGEEEGEDEE